MLESIRRGRRWGTAILVIMVGGVFVAYLGLGGPMQCTQTAALIQVEDRHYYADDLLRVVAQQERYLQEALGEGYDPKTAASWIEQAARSSLVRQAILASEGQRLGLGASVAEEREAVRSIPGLADASGNVDRETYERFYTYEYGSEDAFRRVLRDDLMAQKMQRLLGGLGNVSEAEARDAVLYSGEEVRIGFIAFDQHGGVEASELAAEELEAFASAQPERIAARYEEQRSRFEQEEAVRALHVLVALSSSASEEDVEAARERAERVRARIEAGENFAAVAGEVSEDPGSKERGGDLGFFTRGQMTPPFEEAAFGAQPGELVGPVRSDFGFHVIRVEEHRAGGVQTLDEAREELARELLAEEQAMTAAREQADALLAAVSAGSSLEQAVREADLTLERSSWLQRRPDGFVAGLGASLPLQDAVFALRPDAPSLAHVFSVQNKLALVQLLDRREPEGEELELAIAEQRERLRSERPNQVVQAWVDGRRRELMAAGEIYVDPAPLNERP